MAAIALWTCITSGVMFFVLKSMGILRVPPEDELAGLDESHHGGSAYEMGGEAPAKAKASDCPAPHTDCVEHTQKYHRQNIKPTRFEH
ncbi:MAG: hypothetical protein AAF492_09400 [Verrucomicrobiota bacterium]